MKQELEKSQSVGSDFEVATLGGGCFWCLDPIFKDLKGVVNVVVGYAGGAVKDPTYQMVCTGTTGHAESLQVTFDPRIISYKDLLKIFFSFHDPTTLNRQGADVGTQYRSVIFYHDETFLLAQPLTIPVQSAAMRPPATARDAPVRIVMTLPLLLATG